MSDLVLPALVGPRKAEALRRLYALAEVVGWQTRLGSIVAVIEDDHAGSSTDRRAEVLDAIRIVLGEGPADPGPATEQITAIQDG